MEGKRERGRVWEVGSEDNVEKIFWSQTSLGLNPQVSCFSFLNFSFSPPVDGDGDASQVCQEGFRKQRQHQTCHLSEAGDLNVYSVFSFQAGKSHVGKYLEAGLSYARQTGSRHPRQVYILRTCGCEQSGKL